MVELGDQRSERTAWAKTVRTAQQILQLADGLWTCLETRGIEPTTNAAVDEVFSAGVRALRQWVIQGTISDGV